MKRYGLAGILLLWLTASTCTPQALQIQARIANSVGLAGNRALPLLTDAYRSEGDRIIATARAEGAPRAEAEQRLHAHVQSWERVWGQCDDDTGQCVGGAWPTLRAVHDAWSNALERQIAGETVLDLAAVTQHATDMRNAYCALRATLPADARASLPNIPGLPCP